MSDRGGEGFLTHAAEKRLVAERDQLREALNNLIEFAAEQDHSLYVERGEGMGVKYRENDAITKARAALSEDSTP